MGQAPPIAIPAPVSQVSIDESATARRIIGIVMAMGAAVILGLAAWLTPSSQGLGTHRSLGMPPCGWIIAMDTPCPTCGMTTSFAHAADGNLLASVKTQPFGFLAAIAVAMAFLVGVYTAVTGSRLLSELGRLVSRRSIWTTVGLLLAAWLYKVLSYRGVL